MIIHIIQEGLLLIKEKNWSKFFLKKIEKRKKR